MERSILHCDLNNFYASVALLDYPELRNKAVAVCGDKEERHGIVLAKNMSAKIRGVKTGEVIWQAKKKCPELITVPPNFARYSLFSNAAREIYSDYTDLLEPFGPDEAWIDVTGSSLMGSGEEIAAKIRKRIRNELGLTISVGVSFNKVFSKLGSDLKKPDATSIISKNNFKNIVWGLPANSMIGIGPAINSQLHKMGIDTLGQLANSDENLLKMRFGVKGKEIRQYALGHDNSPVSPIDFKRIPKSIGRSTTYKVDLDKYEDVWRVMLKLSEEVGSELRANELAAYGVQIHLRTRDLTIKELQIPLPFPTQLAFKIAKAGFQLFKQNYDFNLPLRSIGIRAINLQPFSSSTRQYFLFEDMKKEDRLETIEKQMDTLRQRFGKDCIKRGILVGEYTSQNAENKCPFTKFGI